MKKEQITETQVRAALRAIVNAPSETKCGALNYAVNNAIYGLRCPVEELKIQVLYVMNNVSNWRGDDARSVKATLRAFLKQEHRREKIRRNCPAAPA